MQMENFIPFVFVAGFLLMCGGIIYGVFAGRRRREGLARWAMARGMRFSADREHSFDERFAQLKCLQQGHGRYAYNFVSGCVSGRDLLCFDYHYETGSGKSHATHRFSAVIVCANIVLKPLVIRHEGLLDKFAGAMGFDDIDFESARFSREYYVKSPDRKWAYDVLSARTIEFLLEAPKFNLAFDDQHVIAWRDSLLDPAEYEQAIGVIEGVLDHLPDYVIEQQRALAGA